MADKTPIEWTDATWNPITGCSVVSPGCTNCYAMKLAGTRLKHIPSRKGLTVQSKAGPVWNGQVRFNEEFLLQPLGWKKPRMIFVCAHGDLFAEGVPEEWIDKVFAVMALAPQHTFQVLTKRPERMRDYLVGDRNASNDKPHQPHQRILDAAYGLIGNADRFSPIALHLRGMCEASETPLPLPNVWLGVSAEDQKRADERIPLLLETPAAFRWLSAEPLLGRIDLRDFLFQTILKSRSVGQSVIAYNPPTFKTALNWVVAGGESGPSARPMHPDWARSLRDQCAAVGVPFFFKQWGNWAPRGPVSMGYPIVGGAETRKLTDTGADGSNLSASGDNHTWMQRIRKAKAGRILDGVTHDAFPKTERVA